MQQTTNLPCTGGEAGRYNIQVGDNRAEPTVSLFCGGENRTHAGNHPDSVLLSRVAHLPGQEKAQPEAKAEHNRASEIRVVLVRGKRWSSKTKHDGGSKTTDAPGRLMRKSRFRACLRAEEELSENNLT